MIYFIMPPQQDVSLSVCNLLTTYRSLCGRLGRGVIVNVVSTLGLTASVTAIPFPSYVAAKHVTKRFLGQGDTNVKIYKDVVNSLLNFNRSLGIHENGS
jgi:hypothetical protein